MIRQVLPIQFGSGPSWYRWLVNYSDFDLTQANTQIDAAMSAFAKLPTTTLFNYLA